MWRDWDWNGATNWYVAGAAVRFGSVDSLRIVLLMLWKPSSTFRSREVILALSLMSEKSGNATQDSPMHWCTPVIANARKLPLQVRTRNCVSDLATSPRLNSGHG